MGSGERAAIERTTGHAFEDLVEGIRKEAPRRFLSSDRWLHNEALNPLGLHLLRCVLAEKITNARRVSRGWDKHKDYAAFMKEGYIIKDFSEMSDADLRELLQMVSGYNIEHIPDIVWTQRSVTSNPHDNNLNLHVDTFAPSWKVWLYGQDIESEHGPLTYV